ncbi:MAG: hypothetical protein ACYTDT_02605 [Planctomycetota bacterium]|jgi:hypothetical protein
MVEFKPSTWALLLVMLALIVTPIFFMETEPPANNEPEIDPFGFDRSTLPAPDNKPPENSAERE